MKTDKLISCPICTEKFIPGLQRRVTCLNNNCKHIFCKECQENYHEDGTCQEKFIIDRIKDLEALNDPEGVSQCPKCRWPYIKDPSCDHVKCQNSACNVEFCFKCSCIRSPTLAHGNHYHRPQCKNYFAFDGDDDYLPKECKNAAKCKEKNHGKCSHKCDECEKLGKLCPRPKNLKVPRKFAIDEI